MRVIEKPNKNASSRAGMKVDCIVLHIAQGSIQALHNWAVSPNNKSSSWHYGIAKDGTIYHYCPNQLAAWTQGRVLNPTAWIVKDKYKGINPNRYCIGIEHEGLTGQPWTDKMYKADAEVIKYLCKTYDIPMDRKHIIGHYEIDSVNKRGCPGTGFSFDKLFNLLNDDDMYKEKYLKTKKALEVSKDRANKCYDSRRKLSKQHEALKEELTTTKKALKLSEAQGAIKDKAIQKMESQIKDMQERIRKLENPKEKDTLFIKLLKWLRERTQQS